MDTKKSDVLLKYYLVLDILKKEFKTLNKLRKCNVLEIGCSTGQTSRFFCNFFKTYTGSDINKKLINICNSDKHPLYENLTYICDDIIETKIIDKKHIILANNTIHNIKAVKLSKTFSNIFKLLTKNGICILRESLIEPNGWQSDTMNISSPLFDIVEWNKKKKELKDLHKYIMENLNVTYYEYDICRIYLIKK
jgi:SAM-dependent methyltransferase